MPKTHMKKGERVALVEDHSIVAREAQGWTKITPAAAAKLEKTDNQKES